MPLARTGANGGGTFCELAFPSCRLMNPAGQDYLCDGAVNTTERKFRLERVFIMRKLLLLSMASTALALGCPSANAKMFRMMCAPTASAPYTVTYDSDAGVSYITGSRTGATRKYRVLDVKDKSDVHVLYVATKSPNQSRTIYLAFDYSGDNKDVSAIRIINSRSDKEAKCSFSPNQTTAKAAPQQDGINAQSDREQARAQGAIAEAEQLRRENLRLQGELAKHEAVAADKQAQKSADYSAEKQAEAKGAEAEAKRQAEIKGAAIQAEVKTQQQIEAAAEEAPEETLRLQQQAKNHSRLQQQEAQNLSSKGPARNLLVFALWGGLFGAIAVLGYLLLASFSVLLR
jgi:hypothetical protein